MASFEIISEIVDIEVITIGKSIRDLPRLRKLYGEGRWRKMKELLRSDSRMAAFAKPKSTGMKPMESEEKNSNGRVIWNDPMKNTKSRFAICINNREFPASLELHKLYRILPDKEAQADGDLRIIDESGEDYLFPAHYFILVDLPQTIVRALNKSFSQAPAQA